MAERIVQFVSEAPIGWHKVTSEIIHNKLPCEDECIYLTQRRRWIETTGKKPENSQFVLVVPVHDEKVALPSFLSSFMLSDLPGDTRATVVFVSNRCSDGSEQILDHFLSQQTFANPPTADFSEVFSDPGITRISAGYSLGAINFMHIVTTTAGKANAVEIGNDLVLRQNADFLISVDANNYMEPDTLRIIYGEAYRRICIEHSTVVLSGRTNMEIKAAFFSRLAKSSSRRIRGLGRSTRIGVNGCLMAIDSRWLGRSDEQVTNSGISRVGGMPKVATEDFALGLIARSEGQQIDKVETTIWGYEANNPLDRVRLYARHTRGLKQIIRNYPYLTEVIHEDNEHLSKNFSGRMRDFIVWAIDHPKSMPFLLAKWVMMEIGYWKGLWDYWRNPDDHSWKSIRSTKG